MGIRPAFGARACAAMTGSSSDSSRTGAAIASTPRDGAATLKGGEPIFSKCRGRYRIEQHRDPGDVRCNVLEQFQPLPRQRRLRNVETRDVAARSRESRDEAAADRLGNY